MTKVEEKRMDNGELVVRVAVSADGDVTAHMEQEQGWWVPIPMTKREVDRLRQFVETSRKVGKPSIKFAPTRSSTRGGETDHWFSVSLNGVVIGDCYRSAGMSHWAADVDVVAELGECGTRTTARAMQNALRIAANALPRTSAWRVPKAVRL